MRPFFLTLALAAQAAVVVAAEPAAPGAAAPASPYYEVEDIATPPGLSPEVGGLAFMPDGRLVACFHRGEVYTYNPETKEWKLFAQGLHDPLGLIAPKNDEVIVMQRPELTRLRDTNGDGEADRYETICDAFGMSGNYHEFAFGPLAAPDGGWFVALNVASNGSGVRHEVRGEYLERGRDGRMFSVVPWRGWVVKISPDGKLTPWASGFRSPNGLGFDAEGRLFVPDNQGDWIGTSPLYHVQKGNFYGHPASLAWAPKETRPPLTIPVEELDKMRVRGSVVFPQTIMANSPTQPLTDGTEGKFGPFTGQMLLGEMNHARILRVAMEEVAGELQGMAVPLLDDHGLRKGNNRLAFAPDGSLWVGHTDHGWPGDKGIQRIRWTGKVPLDVKEMHLTEAGFELTFTRPLEAASAAQVEAFNAQRYYYEYHQAYGSKQFELETVTPKTVTLSEDRTKAVLEYEALTGGRVYQFDLKALKAEDGEAIANPMVIYTLNHLLGDPAPPSAGSKAPEPKPKNTKSPTKGKVGGSPSDSGTPTTAESEPTGEKKPPVAEVKKATDSKPADSKPAGDQSTANTKLAADKKPSDGAASKPTAKKPPAVGSAPPAAAASTPAPTPRKAGAAGVPGIKR